MWRLPSARPTSWPTIIPPSAGEMTASQSNSRSLSASQPQTFAAISVCWSSSAHWKYWRLCKPERKIKWPSSSAPVSRKSARRSSLMIDEHLDLAGRISSDFAGQSVAVNHGDDFDFDVRSLRQGRDLDRGTGRLVFFYIQTVNFVHRLKITQVGEEDRGLHDVLERQTLGSQNGCNVLKNPSGLCANVAGHDLPGFWIERDLSRAIDCRSNAHGL